MLSKTAKRLLSVPVQERAAFLAKSENIAQSLGIPVDWLIAVMYNESGLNQAAYNPDGGGGGLIGFMPSTAKSLFGLTVDQLRAMSRLQQLEYVYRYYSRFPGKFKDMADFYLYTFYPAAIGKKDHYIIGIERGTNYARQVASSNKIFDLNKDGLIHLGEFRQYVRQRWPELAKRERLKQFLLIAALVLVLIVVVVIFVAGRKLLFA